ncbi:MAG: hypothetical protein EXX96DRAFT_577339 [Benjaminiella poitrasii]|nr:MAG: hypothetical protein EXX96DRAFT_577339 [Benjaminiella poitrasii]
MPFLKNNKNHYTVAKSSWPVIELTLSYAVENDTSFMEEVMNQLDTNMSQFQFVASKENNPNYFDNSRTSSESSVTAVASDDDDHSSSTKLEYPQSIQIDMYATISSKKYQRSKTSHNLTTLSDTAPNLKKSLSITYDSISNKSLPALPHHSSSLTTSCSCYDIETSPHSSFTPYNISSFSSKEAAPITINHRKNVLKKSSSFFSQKFLKKKASSVTVAPLPQKESKQVQLEEDKLQLHELKKCLEEKEVLNRTAKQDKIIKVQNQANQNVRWWKIQFFSRD